MGTLIIKGLLSNLAYLPYLTWNLRNLPCIVSPMCSGLLIMISLYKSFRSSDFGVKVHPKPLSLLILKVLDVGPRV